MRSPGIEPGPPAWQARILPLDQLRLGQPTMRNKKLSMLPRLKTLRRPRIELGSTPWEGAIMPLDQRRVGTTPHQIKGDNENKLKCPSGRNRTSDPVIPALTLQSHALPIELQRDVEQKWSRVQLGISFDGAKKLP